MWKKEEIDLCSVLKASGRGMILDSSMVEHAAVNRGVVGSSPTRGAKMKNQRFFIYEFEPDGSNVAGRFTAHKKELR